MNQLINAIGYILNFGVKLAISTGAIFQPCFQERTHAVSDVVHQESAKYEPNYEYSTEAWTPTFVIKEEDK